MLGQNDLVDIFTKYTTSDISDTETMLQVLKLFIASRNAAIKEVHFPAELGPSYVYASSEAIHEAVEKFLGIEASGGPLGELDEGRSENKKSGKKKSKHHKAPKPHVPLQSRRGATAWCPLAKPAKRRPKNVTRKVSSGFPVFYPTRPTGRRLLPRRQFL